MDTLATKFEDVFFISWFAFSMLPSVNIPKGTPTSSWLHLDYKLKWHKSTKSLIQTYLRYKSACAMRRCTFAVMVLSKFSVHKSKDLLKFNVITIWKIKCNLTLHSPCTWRCLETLGCSLPSIIPKGLKEEIQKSQKCLQRLLSFWKLWLRHFLCLSFHQ